MDEKSHGAPASDASRIVSQRYRLVQLLGKGGNGEVWDAEDLLGSEHVAIKLLKAGPGVESARVRREVSALRLLRIPGVVRLFDEGVDGGQPFLVMERLEGAAFPGLGPHEPAPPAPYLGSTVRMGDEGARAAARARAAAARPRRGWKEIAETTVALLETLARIHAAGIIHRDLKPANVLVNEHGRPTILDFGLSLGARLGEGLTEEGLILGTPAYLAPEQISGEPFGAWTDLYALGVMLYETLSGRFPHDPRHYQSLLVARMSQSPPPLRDVAPEVPSAIAEIVDLLLARSIEDRPRSAADVLGMLRGQPVNGIAESTLPRLGGDGPVRAIVDAARAGRSIDLAGPAGAGRSRCLSEAAAALEAEGRKVVWGCPARRPFGSLEAIFDPLEHEASSALPEITRRVEQRIGELLSQGAAIVVDDAERLDRWSVEALERCRARGAIVKAIVAEERGHRPPPGIPAIHLAPLSEAELCPLFAGPERVFHLRTDAARALWLRTGGLPARVAEEVTAWVRAGVARWSDTLLAVERDALDRLDAGLRMALPSLSRSSPAGAHLRLAPHLQDLLAWMTVAAPQATTEILHAAMEQPAWRVEAELDELVCRGAARRLPDGSFEPLLWAHVEQSWSPERRRSAHRALARVLSPGADGRLFHLIAGQEEIEADGGVEIAHEALTVARRLAAAGHLGRALAALHEGVLALRQSSEHARDRPRPDEEARLLSQWVEIAMSEGTPHALDRVLYELCRADRQTDVVAHLESLVRAALAALSGGERALDAANAVLPFDDPDLERRRQGLRVFAARRCSEEREAAILHEVAAWAQSSDDPRAPASLAGWLGRLRYRQGRFDEAADLHEIAAEGERWVTDRIFETLSTASCLLEAFRHDEAEKRARAACELARSCRHAYYEARAEWLLRSAAYRTGSTDGPDIELVETVTLFGVPTLEALVCLNEAAVAWRAGDLASATSLAKKAHRAFVNVGNGWGAMLARCLAIAAGDAASPGDLASLARQAARCPVSGIGAQALGLLGMADPAMRASCREMLEPLASAIAPPLRGLRMDVLSMAEALEAVRA